MYELTVRIFAPYFQPESTSKDEKVKVIKFDEVKNIYIRQKAGPDGKMKFDGVGATNWPMWSAFKHAIVSVFKDNIKYVHGEAALKQLSKLGNENLKITLIDTDNANLVKIDGSTRSIFTKNVDMPLYTIPEDKSGLPQAAPPNYRLAEGKFDIPDKQNSPATHEAATVEDEPLLFTKRDENGTRIPVDFEDQNTVTFIERDVENPLIYKAPISPERKKVATPRDKEGYDKDFPATVGPNAKTDYKTQFPPLPGYKAAVKHGPATPLPPQKPPASKITNPFEEGYVEEGNIEAKPGGKLESGKVANYNPFGNEEDSQKETLIVDKSDDEALHFIQRDKDGNVIPVNFQDKNTATFIERGIDDEHPIENPTVYTVPIRPDKPSSLLEEEKAATADMNGEGHDDLKGALPNVSGEARPIPETPSKKDIIFNEENILFTERDVEQPNTYGIPKGQETPSKSVKENQPTPSKAPAEKTIPAGFRRQKPLADIKADLNKRAMNPAALKGCIGLKDMKIDLSNRDQKMLAIDALEIVIKNNQNLRPEDIIYFTETLNIKNDPDLKKMLEANNFVQAPVAHKANDLEDIKDTPFGQVNMEYVQIDNSKPLTEQPQVTIDKSYESIFI